MSHVEVLIEFDHLNAEGFEEPHTMQIKVDGLPAQLAWDRAYSAVHEFLFHEQQYQDLVDANREGRSPAGTDSASLTMDGTAAP